MKSTAYQKVISFRDKNVESVFHDYPEPIREKLMKLRLLIFDVASKHPEVGKLEETLKWGQPSYITSESKSGSTIRIDQIKTRLDQYAMYFHCQTNLVETFRTVFSSQFKYEGNRVIIFDINHKIPVKKLRQCILMALTYHLNKK